MQFAQMVQTEKKPSSKARKEKDRKSTQVGDEVFWNDPDKGVCSGYGNVTKVNGEIYSIKMQSPTFQYVKDNGGELEAYEHELE